MSPVGSVGGRTPVGSRVAPIASLHLPAAPADGPCLCGQGPQADGGNPYMGSISGANYGPCDGVSDMRAEITVIDWDDDYSDMAIYVRETWTGSYHYRLQFVPSGPGIGPNPYPNGDWTLKVINAGGTTTLAGPTNQAHPVAGDVIELSAIGTAIVASINGTPLFSVTDSSYAPDTFNQMRVLGTSTSVVFGINIVWEDYCP